MVNFLNRTKDRIVNGPLVQSTPVRLAWRVLCEMRDDDATHLAAGVSYYAIFSLFPLILGFLAISGMILESADLQQKFLNFVTDNLPGSETFVVGNIEGIVRFRGALGIGAVVGLFWAASAVFGGISRAVNRAWDIQQDRPFYIAKPRQLGMALAVGFLFLLSLSASSAIQLLINWDLGIPGQVLFLDAGFAQVAWRAIPWLLTFAIFLLIYRFLPNCKTYWRYVWLGAAIAAVLFEVGKGLFVWYLTSYANYEEVYGPLASVMIFLLWAYASSLILILGAEISSEYERIHHPRGDP